MPIPWADDGTDALVVQPGEVGPGVGDVQNWLNQVGYYVALTSVYDERTAAAVSSFQVGQGLPPTGLVDYRTLEALTAAVNASADPTHFMGGGQQTEMQIYGKIPVGGVVAALGLGWLLLGFLRDKKKRQEAT